MPRKRTLLLPCVFVLASVASASVGGEAVVTPLEQAGLAPVFVENFTDAKMDVMRYSPAYGSKEQYNTYVQPGAIFMGQKGATENTEQQINYFPERDGPNVSTIEFDVRPTALAQSRVLVRPRRFKDGVHVWIGLPGEKTEVIFRNEPGGYKRVRYGTPTGPRHGWAHVAVSYRVDREEMTCELVVAVNGEVHGRPGISQDPRPGDKIYPFSLEYNGPGPENGYYIANVRGYAEFLSEDKMRDLLEGRVVAHLAKLEDPTQVEGDWPQLVEVDESLINVMQKPDGMDETELIAVPKSVVKVMRGPYVEEPVWITKESDVAARNLVIKFNGAYRIAKVVYDSRGRGPAKGHFQSKFKLGLGYGGWGDQKFWSPIAAREGLTEGAVFTFYPRVAARYFKVYDTTTIAEENDHEADFWFVNVETLRLYAIPDPELANSGREAHGERTDERGQFVGTAGLHD